jgi:hypothetical protein
VRAQQPGPETLAQEPGLLLVPALNAASHWNQIVVSSCSVRVPWFVALIHLLRAMDESATASLSADAHWLA